MPSTDNLRVWVARIDDESGPSATGAFKTLPGAEKWAVDRIGRDEWTAYTRHLDNAGEPYPDYDTAPASEILTCWFGPSRHSIEDGNETHEYGIGHAAFILFEHLPVGD